MTPHHVGKYELRGKLPGGAMAAVYDGWDPTIPRRVAIKTVHLADAAADEEAAEALARFRREAQAAGRLSHPNIVAVYDTGETDELAYLVMEFVEGRSLKAVLDQEKTLPPSEIAEIMGQVLAGLEYSHRRGIIHRDIKPANVMLTAEGLVKLVDFGIARIATSSATSVRAILGTPAYMPPEQFLGEPADARSDIYAAGAMLFHLLTGTRPFEGGPAAIMSKVLNALAAPSPSERAVGVSPAWDSVIARSMARRPADRFPSADAFAAAIRIAAAAAPWTTDADATIAQLLPPATVAPRGDGVTQAAMDRRRSRAATRRRRGRLVRALSRQASAASETRICATETHGRRTGAAATPTPITPVRNSYGHVGRRRLEVPASRRYHAADRRSLP